MTVMSACFAKCRVYLHKALRKLKLRLVLLAVGDRAAKVGGTGEVGDYMYAPLTLPAPGMRRNARFRPEAQARSTYRAEQGVTLP